MGPRIIRLDGELDDRAAEVVIAKLLFFEADDAIAALALHINSPGGSITSALAVLDVCGAVAPPVVTVCVGQAMGTGALILAGGARGQRFALPTARIGLVPFDDLPLPPAGQAVSGYHELLRLKDAFLRNLAERTNRPADLLGQQCDARTIWSPEEAVQMGFIDAVIPDPRARP